MDEYLVPTAFGEDEFYEKKSHFIGRAWPVETEEEALEKIQAMKKQHYDATHNCWAYIIRDGAVRFSDDGEPGGTAGMPIMDVMRNRSVVNCCIVVVRYFGGVLLGTGGLVRAYTRSAQAALEAAGVARMELTSSAYAEVPYQVWDKFRYAAERLPVRIGNVEYGSSVGFRLCYRSAEESDVLPRLMDAAERKLELLPEGESFSPWEIKA